MKMCNIVEICKTFKLKIYEENKIWKHFHIIRNVFIKFFIGNNQIFLLKAF